MMAAKVALPSKVITTGWRFHGQSCVTGPVRPEEEEASERSLASGLDDPPVMPGKDDVAHPVPTFIDCGSVTCRNKTI